jgi:hypothetical protein
VCVFIPEALEEFQGILFLSMIKSRRYE